MKMVTVQDLKDILIDTINDIDNYDLLDRIINYIDVLLQENCFTCFPKAWMASSMISSLSAVITTST